MINNRIEEIFNLKKELNAIKITPMKKNLKNTKYINFDDEIYRRLKFIKRVTASISITLFKIISHEISRRHISVTDIFVNPKSNNKYLDVKEFYDTKNNKFYEN